MGFTAKEKDDVLSIFNDVGSQLNLSDFISDDIKIKGIAILLSENGLLKETSYKGGAIYQLTNKGYAFKENGGYSALEKAREKELSSAKEEKRKEKRSERRWSTFQLILNGIITFILGYLLSKLT